MTELRTNILYYGDNLDILRKHIPEESVDLIYLDPPFNSQATYNVLFKEPTGELSAAQLRAFSDTWEWDLTAERTFKDIIEGGLPQVARMIAALREFIGRNAMMAYLVMMTVRLVELRRVLKPTGSLYLHCDPTASHYLKVVLDVIFGKKNFRNEIVWNYGARGTVRQKGGFPRRHHTLFFYSKSSTFVRNPLYRPYKDPEMKRYNKVDEQGRRYALIRRVRSGTGEVYYGRTYPKDEGAPATDVWDIALPAATSGERLGYETQKPLALLERIISASSNEGDVLLDPFCGCGTAVVAAHKLGRRWIGIDLTYLAITVMKKRLEDTFGLKAGRDYQVVGEPADLAGARALAAQDRYQFQWWALSLVGASPVGDDRKKGADRGLDGVIGFMEQGGKAKRVIVQVKSGHVNAAQVRDLKGTMEREKAEMGLFITLEPPTAPMRKEAVSASFYHSELWKEDYPRIQVCTVEDLLAGKLPRLPRHAYGGFARAERVKREEGKQEAML